MAENKYHFEFHLSFWGSPKPKVKVPMMSSPRRALFWGDCGESMIGGVLQDACLRGALGCLQDGPRAKRY